jgi:hypothetical protein
VNEPTREDGEIGALWQKTSEKGGAFLAGYILASDQRHEIVAFRRPDDDGYRIFRSRPRSEKKERAPELGRLWTPSDDPYSPFSGVIRLDDREVSFDVVANPRQRSERQPSFLLMRTEEPPRNAK